MVLLMAAGWCRAAAPGGDDDYVVSRWQEEEYALPAAPQSDDLLPFYVSPTAEHRFFVDSRSLAVGKDGVVRYVLVVLAAQGGRNVTFEGMRCETRERRIYAVGRADGSWSSARRSEWVRISDVAGNRHHAALFLDYFCPNGVIVNGAAEARDELRRSGRFGSLAR